MKKLVCFIILFSLFAGSLFLLFEKNAATLKNFEKITLVSVLGTFWGQILGILIMLIVALTFLFSMIGLGLLIIESEPAQNLETLALKHVWGMRRDQFRPEDILRRGRSLIE